MDSVYAVQQTPELRTTKKCLVRSSLLGKFSLGEFVVALFMNGATKIGRGLIVLNGILSKMTTIIIQGTFFKLIQCALPTLVERSK